MEDAIFKESANEARQAQPARIFHSLRHRYDIFLLAIPMMAVIKGYAGLARVCRPARSARGSSTVCTQAIE
jgi:hypothetical protein